MQITPEPIRVNGLWIQAPLEGADQIPDEAELITGHREAEQDQEVYGTAGLEEEVPLGYIWQIPPTDEEPWEERWAAYSLVTGPVTTKVGGPTHQAALWAKDALGDAHIARYLEGDDVTALIALVQAGVLTGRDQHPEVWGLSGVLDGMVSWRLAVLDPQGDSYGSRARYVPTPFTRRLIAAYEEQRKMASTVSD